MNPWPENLRGAPEDPQDTPKLPKGFSKRADKALEMLLSEIRSASNPGLANQVKVDDTDAADHFFEVLGFGRHDPVMLSAGGKQAPLYIINGIEVILSRE